jgi:chemotaxis protein methyltransferase CheR
MLLQDHDRAPPSSSRAADQTGPISLPPSLFRAFRELAYRQAGIQLRDGKETLLATRIARRMSDLGLTDPVAYLARLRDDPSGDEMVRFLDSICTNLTGFYRDAEHFSILAAEAGRLKARGERRCRVWCAAAASGEEPYSAAITLCEAFAGTQVDFRILSTDLSTSALGAAKAGRYTERQLEPVPDRLRWKYFTPIHRRQGIEYEVSPRLRERVVFARLNLAAPPFPMAGPFDAILCRNVMIYFDPPVRQRLLDEIARLLRPGGLLMVGQAETLCGLRHPLDEVRPSIFRKPLRG